MTTLRSLIIGSMRLTRVVGANEVPTKEDETIALKSLRGLLDSLRQTSSTSTTRQTVALSCSPARHPTPLGRR